MRAKQQLPNQSKVRTIADEVRERLQSKKVKDNISTRAKSVSERAVKKKFIKCFYTTKNVSKACEILGISRKTIYKWHEEDEKFRKSFSQVTRLVFDELEEVAIQRALRHSDVLLMFLLRANKPEKYNDKFSGMSSPPAESPEAWIKAAHNIKNKE